MLTKRKENGQIDHKVTPFSNANSSDFPSAEQTQMDEAFDCALHGIAEINP